MLATVLNNIIIQINEAFKKRNKIGKFWQINLQPKELTNKKRSNGEQSKNMSGEVIDLRGWWSTRFTIQGGDIALHPAHLFPSRYFNMSLQKRQRCINYGCIPLGWRSCCCACWFVFYICWGTKKKLNRSFITIIHFLNPALSNSGW